MYFLNYNETNLNYIYLSNLRLILLKQNIKLKNVYLLNLPKIQLNFIFLKLIELNILKLFNNVMLLWLLTKNKSNIKKLNNRLERGIRYYRFVLINIINKDIICLKFLDFIVNKLFYLLEKKNLKKFLNNNDFFCRILNLELFSNMRLSNNFFSPKINDKLLLKFYLIKKQKKIINIKHMLQIFKLYE